MEVTEELAIGFGDYRRKGVLAVYFSQVHVYFLSLPLLPGTPCFSFYQHRLISLCFQAPGGVAYLFFCVINTCPMWERDFCLKGSCSYGERQCSFLTPKETVLEFRKLAKNNLNLGILPAFLPSVF